MPQLTPSFGLYILGNWQKPHISSLICAMKIIMVGKANWKLPELLIARKLENQNQSHFLVMTAEFSATIKDLKGDS